MFDYAYYSTNAYLLAQYKLSQLCGAFTNKKFTRCTLCKKSFDNEEQLQVHVKTCKKLTDEWKKFELEIDDWAKIFTIYQERVYNASTACAECGPWSMYRILVKRDFNTARGQVLDALPAFFDALFIRFLEKNKDVANFISSKEPAQKTVHLAFLKKGKEKEKIGKVGKCENGPQLAEDAGDLILNFLDGTDIDDWDGYWNNSEDEECDDDFCDSEDDGG
ncbi:hypothetical protein GCK72_025983 [Caenorhabditis remanei]|uniref:Uncharacterized protein n=1 Tax=Caenorhabditis remanei TaxID=31234 RepID=A0A6A5G484_CAERE|nr:hypothetical protein GCK72_025983 [Caenorhabditis remanei]KAF1749515.1 hypothetical protein GCK72_025983 [Caenorhabditis remanei]